MNFVTGFIKTTNSGTFGLKWAQLSSSTDNTTLKDGSWIELIKLN